MAPRTRNRPDELVVSDPQAIRALAHPARLQVIEALRDQAELTATQCAAETGLSASAMSYHLRALERWGFVERGESADGRERPWRATAQRWRFEQLPGSVASAAAADATLGAVLVRIRAAFAEWFEHEGDQPREWQDVGAVSTSLVWLTADEAAELQRVQEQTLEDYGNRSAEDHPEGARRVRIATLTVPLDFTPPASVQDK